MKNINGARGLVWDGMQVEAGSSCSLGTGRKFRGHGAGAHIPPFIFSLFTRKKSANRWRS